MNACVYVRVWSMCMICMIRMYIYICVCICVCVYVFMHLHIHVSFFAIIKYGSMDICTFSMGTIMYTESTHGGSFVYDLYRVFSDLWTVQVHKKSHHKKKHAQKEIKKKKKRIKQSHNVRRFPLSCSL